MDEATKAGALQSTRLIIAVAEAADRTHVDGMQQAASVLRDFVQRMNIPSSQIVEWARPHLESLSSMLLGAVPPCGFPADQKRVVARYQAQFDERLKGALRDVEIGFAKGGFAGQSNQDEWIGAAEAIATLKPILTEYSAQMRICERAHGGLIRSRAEQFHAHSACFTTTTSRRSFGGRKVTKHLSRIGLREIFRLGLIASIQLKAFGVTFARADIHKLLPPRNSLKADTVTLTEEDDQVIGKLDALVPSAAQSYKQAILDLTDSSRVSFRGPALELREALREILDHLAPDSEVTAAPGYAQEKDRHGPTMKQKVRFIMKKNGKRSSSDAPEQTVTAFEEAIAGLTRAVYERSSKAAHVAGERQTVVQIRRYVVAILHEIIPG